MELEPLRISHNAAWEEASNHKDVKRQTGKEISIEAGKIDDNYEVQVRSSYSSAKGNPWRRVSMASVASRQKLQSIPRKHIVAGSLLSASIIISSILIGLASGYTNRTSKYVTETSDSDCDLVKASGGQFVVSMGLSNGVEYDVSPLELSFAIDIRTPATLTLTQAKAIDVIWNIIIGQGLRLVLGYIIYKTSCDLLSVFMKRSKVPYPLYVSLCLDGPSISTIREAVISLFKASISHSRLTLTGLVLSMIYTIAFPVLTSTTSGYLVPTRIRYEMPDGILVPNVGNTTYGCYQVHDGSRIGLQDNAVIQGPTYDVLANGDGKEEPLESKYPLFYELRRYKPDFPANYTWDVAGYMELTSSITFNGTYYQLDAPPLNMRDAYTTPTNYSHATQRCYNDQILDISWTPDVVCIPHGEGYVWGLAKYFSIGLLAIHIVWSIVTYMIWRYANLELDVMDGKERLYSKMQSSGRLSNSLQNDVVPDFYEYTDLELEEALKGKKGGVSFKS